jgi:hypothetical protein
MGFCETGQATIGYEDVLAKKEPTRAKPAA